MVGWINHRLRKQHDSNQRCWLAGAICRSTLRQCGCDLGWQPYGPPAKPMTLELSCNSSLRSIATLALQTQANGDNAVSKDQNYFSSPKPSKKRRRLDAG